MNLIVFLFDLILKINFEELQNYNKIFVEGIFWQGRNTGHIPSIVYVYKTT